MQSAGLSYPATPMRLLSLFALGAVLLSGCSSSLFDRDGRSDRNRRSYPASARVDNRGGEALYRMCHDGNDNRTVRNRDVQRHLDHGDRFGYCRSDRRDTRQADRRDRDDDRYRDRYRSTRDYPRSARVRERGRTMYRMCHNGRTQTFNENAVRGHLNHGDRFGSCRR